MGVELFCTMVDAISNKLSYESESNILHYSKRKKMSAHENKIVQVPSLICVR